VVGADGVARSWPDSRRSVRARVRVGSAGQGSGSGPPHGSVITNIIRRGEGAPDGPGAGSGLRLRQLPRLVPPRQDRLLQTLVRAASTGRNRSHGRLERGSGVQVHVSIADVSPMQFRRALCALDCRCLPHAVPSSPVCPAPDRPGCLRIDLGRSARSGVRLAGCGDHAALGRLRHRLEAAPRSAVRLPGGRRRLPGRPSPAGDPGPAGSCPGSPPQRSPVRSVLRRPGPRAGRVLPGQDLLARGEHHLGRRAAGLRRPAEPGRPLRLRARSLCGPGAGLRRDVRRAAPEVLGARRTDPRDLPHGPGHRQLRRASGG
jgi:hypothetical protein